MGIGNGTVFPVVYLECKFLTESPAVGKHQGRTISAYQPLQFGHDGLPEGFFGVLRERFDRKPNVHLVCFSICGTYYSHWSRLEKGMVHVPLDLETTDKFSHHVQRPYGSGQGDALKLTGQQNEAIHPCDQMGSPFIADNPMDLIQYDRRNAPQYGSAACRTQKQV
jgi:hypothetical protein